MEPSLAALWQVGTAFLMAFTTGRDGEGTAAWREEAGALPVPAPGEPAARAAEHGDEHVIKVTEACLREYALVPEERYLAAAAAAQRRIPPLRQGGGGRGLTRA
ncbi:hypothetical protein RM780_21730 [Streptomyces sp. DSM 44917]|uniref:Uncharacterized protein n=1 Tax=Streptomyces boetiae TaxID=3075541 RepID=A0ABU2LDA8_9ACTN|nr:hypothetical protein [Streptomyces sp. DSM 44917]MDT0309557.1 hypothetical protein [Streptomyces sp. DSM 44917]